MTRSPSRITLVAALAALVLGACSSDADRRAAGPEPVLVGRDLDPEPEVDAPASGETPTTSTAVPTTAAAEPEASSPERLLLGTAGGVVALDPATDTVVDAEPAALASRDGRRLVRSQIVGDTTEVAVVDAATGAVRATQVVAGQWAPRVLSDDGRRIVLGPTNSYADGRDRTTLVAVEPEAGTEPRSLYVVGNVEPEAYSTDGRALFVLQYTPPLAPTQYQVRRLDLGTGVVDDVPDKASGWGDAMAGTARTHALAPDGRRLYTLYTTGDPAAGTATAFVHVLDLDEQWAFCVDLPIPFGTVGGGARMTIAVSPDSSKVYVADLAGGAVAEIDASTLAVSAMARFDNLLPSDAAASSTVASDGSLWLGQGGAAVAIDASLGGVTSQVFTPEDVTGVALSADAHRLYLGQSETIQVFDTRTRQPVGVLVAPGRLTGFDAGTPPIEAARSAIACTAVTPVALGPGALARGRLPRC
jgi:DNA-binding beta-propeller fold protein YncE